MYHRRITSLITFCTSYSRHPWPLDESYQINVSNVYLFTFFFFCKLRNIHLLVSHQPTVTTHACKDRFSFGDVIVAYKNIKLLMCTFIVIFSPSSVYNLDKPGLSITSWDHPNRNGSGTTCENLTCEAHMRYAEQNGWHIHFMNYRYFMCF